MIKNAAEQPIAVVIKFSCSTICLFFMAQNAIPNSKAVKPFIVA
jgi:hypothetical protein